MEQLIMICGIGLFSAFAATGVCAIVSEVTNRPRWLEAAKLWHSVTTGFGVAMALAWVVWALAYSWGRE